MTAPHDTTKGEQLLADAGIVSTPEGRKRARARLAAAREKLTPERREQLRQVGRTAAA